jgi:hypothetical protein
MPVPLSVSHGVPLLLATPVSSHVEPLPEQLSVPRWHTYVGVHVAPASQAIPSPPAPSALWPSAASSPVEPSAEPSG